MNLDQRIENLRNSGSLKSESHDPVLVKQYLINARELRGDAYSASSALGRFTLAYEALHALAMAFLNRHGVRTAESDGHRSVALQLAVGELTMDADFKGAVAATIQIHKARNETTYYRPIPPVSEKVAAATLRLLDAALLGAKTQLDPYSFERIC